MNEKLILVVDDEPDICSEISGFLSHKGYQVIIAHNGKDGLKLFKQHQPVLVLSDYKMPVMNGIELLKGIKSISKNIHVILISGAADSRTIVEAMKEQAFDFIPKPVDLNDLMKIVTTAIEKTLAKHSQESLRLGARNLVGEVSHVGDNISVFYMIEDMDEHSALRYDTYFKKIISDHVLTKNVVLFLKNVKYINNMGLNFLISLNDQLIKRESRLYLCALSQQVDFYLRSLGYLDYFKVEANVNNIVEHIQMEQAGS